MSVGSKYHTERWRLMPSDLVLPQQIGASSISMVDQNGETINKMQQLSLPADFKRDHEPDIYQRLPQDSSYLVLSGEQTLIWNEQMQHDQIVQCSVLIEKGAKIKLIHHIKAGFSLRGLDIFIASDAVLEHVVLLDHRDIEPALIYDHIKVDQGAKYQLSVSTKSEGFIRHVVRVDLIGSIAQALVHSAARCLGHSQTYSYYDIFHDHQHTKSTQRMQTVLDDQAYYAAISQVSMRCGSEKSESYQRFDHLLLSEQSHAFTKPALDIEIDDIISEHGATVGSMDEQQLMYMHARGFDIEQAKQAYMNASVSSIYAGVALASMHLEHLEVI